MKTKAELEREVAELRVELVKAQTQRDTVIDVLKIVAKEQRVVHHDNWGYRSWPWTYCVGGTHYEGTLTYDCNSADAVCFANDAADSGDYFLQRMMMDVTGVLA